MKPDSPTAEQDDSPPSVPVAERTPGPVRYHFQRRPVLPPIETGLSFSHPSYCFSKETAGHVAGRERPAAAAMSPGELRPWQERQQQFVQNAAAGLTTHLGMDFSLKLKEMKTVAYRELAATWGNPAHLALFKMEPLRGVSILEISSRLALGMVDRLMGGPGDPPAADQEMSGMEKALLEPCVQLLLETWCGRWSDVKELKPVILGYESSGHFIQAAPPETILLALCMEGSMGASRGRLQLGFPYASVEPLVRRFRKDAAPAAPPARPASPAPATPWKWNPCFDDVRVPVTAGWEGLELTARQILALKVGDVLPLDAQRLQQICVRVADVLRFQGRPGTLAGQWAVELTQALRS